MLIGSHSNRKSYHAASEVPHWSVSVPMTLGDLERQVARCPVFLADSCLTNSDQIWHSDPDGGGHASSPRGGAPAPSNFGTHTI